MFGVLRDFDDSLFRELKRLQRELNQPFGSGVWPVGIRAVNRYTFPPVNVGMTPEKVVVYLFAAGVDPQDFDISIQQNLLSVSGRRSLPLEEGANYYRRERYDGEFRRTISLPEDVDPDRVDAHYKDGILSITVHRREVARPRQIEIK